MLLGWGLKEGPLFLPYPCIIPAEPIQPDYLPHPSPLEVGTVLHYTLKDAFLKEKKKALACPCSPQTALLSTRITYCTPRCSWSGGFALPAVQCACSKA